MILGPQQDKYRAVISGYKIVFIINLDSNEANKCNI